MKIEQLEELKDLTTKGQLQRLVREDENNIDEFIHIQKFFEEEINSSKEIARIPLTKQSSNNFIELMYKLSTNGYPYTVNSIISKLRDHNQEILKNQGGESLEQSQGILNNIYQIVKKIADDIEKGITYDNKFIDNLISCTIEDGKSYLSLFDLYNNAENEPMVTDMIRSLISDKKFTIKRRGNIYDLIIKLKKIVHQENQTQSNNIPNYIEDLFTIIKSNELLEERTSKEHLYIASFFLYAFNENYSNQLSYLSTSSKVIKNRSFDEQLYLLSLYHDLIKENESDIEALNCLFFNDQIYTKLSFDFQIYLIDIVNNMQESTFAFELQNHLAITNIFGGDIEYKLKQLIKDYTDYAESIEDIIKKSDDGAEAIKVISSEAKKENITEFDANTKLVLVPRYVTDNCVYDLKRVLDNY